MDLEALSYLPSRDGVTALLDAGLAGVGDAAGTGIATASAGIIPAWGEARTGPLGVFPILFCLGDLGLIPGLGRSPGEGNGNPLQYSCLGNPMDRGMVSQKSWTQLSD